MAETPQEEKLQIRELAKAQRRVLGVLVEKAFTTPENYPLTLKAVTTGCNQKSNRYPITNLSEYDVSEVLDELRKLGLVAVVHTESGRTERFRHYMRHRFTFSEPQLALLTELLLRGRQQVGELRSRASRMVSIDSLDQLRDDLRGLQTLDVIQTSGPLERRGIEVDHNWYAAKEGQTLRTQPLAEGHSQTTTPTATASPPVTAPAASPTVSSQDGERVATLEKLAQELRSENQELRSDLDEIKEEFRKLSDQFDDLRRDLGG